LDISKLNFLVIYRFLTLPGAAHAGRSRLCKTW